MSVGGGGPLILGKTAPPGRGKRPAPAQSSARPGRSRKPWTGRRGHWLPPPVPPRHCRALTKRPTGVPGPLPACRPALSGSGARVCGGRIALTWRAWRPGPAEISFVTGRSCPSGLSLRPLEPSQSREAWGDKHTLKWDRNPEEPQGLAGLQLGSCLEEEGLCGKGRAFLPAGNVPHVQAQGRRLSFARQGSPRSPSVDPPSAGGLREPGSPRRASLTVPRSHAKRGKHKAKAGTREKRGSSPLCAFQANSGPTNAFRMHTRGAATRTRPAFTGRRTPGPRELRRQFLRVSPGLAAWSPPRGPS